ncbi:MAG: DUF3943 domain-containing protein [Bacteroidota bacterium]|nr:DUF3943 domain-containing protein [Bacteroidota bacterium]
MCFHKNSFIPFFCLILFSANGQINVNSDSVSKIKHPDSLLTIPKDPLRAAGLVLANNLAVWTNDRLIEGGAYARINLNTIKFNFKTGFVGDNDWFVTNLLAHPYHGSTYFNAARSNGMNFWQSVPFAATGSLMWEFLLENEPASINDFISSTVGGSSLGEICYRVSDRFIDDRTVGFDRFRREALLTLISPLTGLNRILTGEAWKHRNVRGNSTPAIPLTFYSSIGHRILADGAQTKHDVSNMLCYDLGLFYGNPFDPENEKPYDFFTFKLSGNLFSRQSVISRINLIGLLYSSDICPLKTGRQLTWGIFQHYNFYQLDAESNVSLNPYKLSETASFGPGILFKSNLTNQIIFSGSAHLSVILLGGNQSDHYTPGYRDYNMGSGFSSKLNFELLLDSRARLCLNAENYRIYSWIGNLPYITETSGPSARGEAGHADQSIILLNFSYMIGSHILLSAETGYYYRRNVYAYYPETIHSISEKKLSVGYIF